jgi:hypothetical protein
VYPIIAGSREKLKVIMTSKGIQAFLCSGR